MNAFGRYQPSDPVALRAWNKHIGPDAGATIDGYRAKLKANNKIGEVFRYHNLPEYMAGLKA